MRRTLLVAALVAGVTLSGVARGAPERTAAVKATVAVAVSGEGRVVSEPAGAIDCAPRCSAEIDVGAALVLRAVPAAGRALSGWGGECSGTSPTCELVVEGPSSVTATFGSPPALTAPTGVDVTRSAGGTVVSDPAGLIDCGTVCTAAWPGGGNVTIRARASSGFVFRGWRGDCSGNDDACRLTLNQDRDATALFVREPIPSGSSDLVITNRNPPGSGSTTGSLFVQYGDESEFCEDARCTIEDIEHGTPVEITSADGTLRAWEGACTGTAELCRLVMSGPAEVIASFRPDGPRPSFGINVSKSGLGQVRSSPNGIDCPTSTCAAAFGEKTRVRLSATPSSAKWIFVGWRGDCGGTADCSLIADTTRSATAVFRLSRRPLRVELRGRGRGVVRSTPAGIECPPDCTYAFPDGAGVALSAAPQAGSLFAGWTGACTGASCTVSVGAETVVRARFDRCATLDFRGFVAKVLRAPRRIRVALVLTGQARVRVVVLRGRATVRQVRTGRLAPGTRTLSVTIPRRAKAGRHTVRVTLTDACGGTKARTRSVRLR